MKGEEEAKREHSGDTGKDVISDTKDASKYSKTKFETMRCSKFPFIVFYFEGSAEHS